MYDINIIELSHELSQIVNDIKKLRLRKKQIISLFKKYNQKPIGNEQYFTKPIWLYVLELQNGKYYVGMTRNVDKRFQRHLKGKGAKWTKVHQPVKIIYQENTKLINESEAAILEDNLTIETAENYGYDNVRGGKWCYINKNPHEYEEKNWIKIL